MSADLPIKQGIGLQVRGLRKSYDGCEVLKGLDFEVKPGEIFVIMGPSGSGKSVLLKHLIGLEAPDAGGILLDGEPIHSPENLGRYRVTMVFQSGALFDSMTATSVGPTNRWPRSTNPKARLAEPGKFSISQN